MKCSGEKDPKFVILLEYENQYKYIVLGSFHFIEWDFPALMLWLQMYLWHVRACNFWMIYVATQNYDLCQGMTFLTLLWQWTYDAGSVLVDYNYSPADHLLAKYVNGFG